MKNRLRYLAAFRLQKQLLNMKNELLRNTFLFYDANNVLFINSLIYKEPSIGLTIETNFFFSSY